MRARIGTVRRTELEYVPLAAFPGDGSQGMGAEEPGIRQNVIAGRDAYVAGRDVVIGSGNVQVNSYGRRTTRGPLVVGSIPQEPPAFQPRADLLAELRSAGPGVSVVRAVTGMHGVGKTQLVAAYARERIAAGWPVVAWANAEEMPEVLSCLAEVAGRLGIAEPGPPVHRPDAWARLPVS